ncbi:MAG: hypothetical protein EKK30_17260 [Hyphomicrobium sp.]|nr:MAG: hypothetical protein EKK30_17260 [Hyphomicrobium sp.]
MTFRCRFTSILTDDDRHLIAADVDLRQNRMENDHEIFDPCCGCSCCTFRWRSKRAGLGRNRPRFGSRLLCQPEWV